MWRAIALAVLLAGTVSGKLTGDHICQEEERYSINVTEYFIRNATIRNYQWCMNVPPRCSFYTTKLINDSRVVEKEIADFVDRCCPGFEEDEESKTCRPTCPAVCVHGTCEDGICKCSSGYKGEFCNTVCDDLEWGEDCSFPCRCERGTCDSVTGSCNCPSGWSGTKCQVPCQTGSYGKNCLETCECKPNEFCHHITGECESPTSVLISPQEENLTTITIPATVTKVPDNKTTKSYSYNREKNTIVTFKNNGKFHRTHNNISEIITITGPSMPIVVDQDKLDDDNKSLREPAKSAITNDLTPSITHREEVGNEESEKRSYINIQTTNRPIEMTKSSKAKVNEKEVSVTSTELINLLEENYLNDEASKENVSQPPANKNDMVSGASAATAISIGIIIIAVAIVVVNRCRRSRKDVKEEADRAKGVSTAVSVYTHSIFHTPLPEPPTFENPIFITPVAETNPAPATTDGQRFETHVVCSMNFQPYPSKDPREYLYDHPPSTGSYRAASIPEPPDIDMQSLPTVEPLYDEIPSGQPPTPISEPPPSYKSSLYMNTCGKTRL